MELHLELELEWLEELQGLEVLEELDNLGKLEALEDLEDLGEPAVSDSLPSDANPYISVRNDYFWCHRPSVLKLELGLELGEPIISSSLATP